MAKKYHPDVQGSADGQEVFVVVAKAYQTLAHPKSRALHDDQLKQALLWESEPAFKKKIALYRQQGLSEARRKAWAFAAAKKEISDFEKGNAKFPYAYRIVAGIICALFALKIIYTNYFIDLNSNELPWIILGFGLFVVSCVSVLAHLYKKLRIDLLLKRAKWPYDSFSFGVFFTMLVVGPSMVFGLNKYRQSYHLNHYPALATAKIVEVSYDNDVLFAFKPMHSEHVIMKRKTIDDNKIFDLKAGWIIVRYSEADPRIVELVNKSD